MCKSKLKDTSNISLISAGTGTFVHYHYWLSVTINVSLLVSMFPKIIVNLCVCYTWWTSAVRTFPSWVGAKYLAGCAEDTLNGHRRSRTWQHCLRHSSHMQKIRSVWLPPYQWIIVILEQCGSEIICKFLAHGQRKISTIWLAGHRGHQTNWWNEMNSEMKWTWSEVKMKWSEQWKV